MRTKDTTVPIGRIVVDGELPGAAEVRALVESIGDVGLIHPITLTRDHRIIAGRHRLAACKHLGWTRIPARFVDLDGLREELLTIDENLRRRTLTVLEEARLVGRRKTIYQAMHPETRPVTVRGGPGRGRRSDGEPIPTPFAEDMARRVGKAPRTIRRLAYIAERLDRDAADLLQGSAAADNQLKLLRLASLDPASQRAVARRVAAGEVHLGAAVREEQWRRTVGATPGRAGDTYDLLHGDFVAAAGRIPDQSVDMVLTDPPWDAGFADRLPELAALVDRVLRPGRACLVMVGQPRLPDVLDAMRPTLRYVWTFAYLFEGNRAPQAKVQICRWVPILYFVARGEITMGARGTDLYAEREGSMGIHPWEKDASTLADMITTYTRPGDLVLDPFCGSGSTGVAALSAGRRFIGIDVDPDAIALSSRKLAEAEPEYRAARLDGVACD